MKLAPKRLDSLFSVAYNCHDKLCLVGWLVVCLFAVGGGGGCGGGGGGGGDDDDGDDGGGGCGGDGADDDDDDDDVDDDDDDDNGETILPKAEDLRPDQSFQKSGCRQ